MTAEEAAEFRLELMEVVRAMSERYIGRTPESHPGTESVQLQTALFPDLDEARAWARGAAGGDGTAGATADHPDDPGGEPGR
ncbi:hypothetical protein [Nocardiopsis sp. NRRL B-16309]|uniref:hypothetical protein n=1 Tax=Nocardiopsis sp. NRRL B-16309 TaxID=1519494 RepID=UPI0006AEE29D|nr:hypothetical protein [Nocardiopsis sp. NRRL B-16309]KOX10242.1 hypothetical protein ADL05_26660 [Nocardiopsis sp. NRRL B-16309]